MFATLRPSRHVQMVWRFANISAPRRACRARGIWKKTRQMGKLAKKHGAEFPELFIDVLVRCGKLNEEVNSILITVTSKLLPWNLTLIPHARRFI